MNKEKDSAPSAPPNGKKEGAHSVSPQQEEFTPGPWHVGPHYKSDVESREGRICECTPLSSPRAAANARLIAAAPDLLEACMEFVRKCECGEARSRRSYAQMKTAIAKAEGR